MGGRETEFYFDAGRLFGLPNKTGDEVVEYSGGFVLQNEYLLGDAIPRRMLAALGRNRASGACANTARGFDLTLCWHQCYSGQEDSIRAVQHPRQFGCKSLNTIALITL